MPDTREEIIKYLLTPTGCRQERSWPEDGAWAFCFDVKLHRLDLSFWHLLTVWADYGHITAADRANPAVLTRLRQLHENACADTVADTATADACRPYLAGDKQLLPGGRHVPCAYQFMGQHKGWLVLTRFNHVRLEQPIASTLQHMSWQTLQDLFATVKTLERDLDDTEPERAVERCAATLVFDVDEDILLHMRDKDRSLPGYAQTLIVMQQRCQDYRLDFRQEMLKLANQWLETHPEKVKTRAPTAS